MTLTPEKIKHFENRLLENKELLLVAIESEKKSSQVVELDQSKVGRLSRMDALQGQAMLKETQSRHEEGLRNISTALSRIGSGDYGYCVDCDEEIAAARLEVDPAVSLCINCANRAEKG